MKIKLGSIAWCITAQSDADLYELDTKEQ